MVLCKAIFYKARILGRLHAVTTFQGGLDEN